MNTPTNTPANSGLDFKAHAHQATEVVERLGSSYLGLSLGEVQQRLGIFGRNALPKAKQDGLPVVFLRQFLSPLIYILLLAAFISIALGEYSDAAFIFGVLMINAVIGTIQEFSAQRSASALQQLVTTSARVQREGDAHEIDAEELVPGDIVLLEEGIKVPADLRLIDSRNLEIDESLLTGESLPVAKSHGPVLEPETTLADRINMAFAGTMVSRGRGRGIITATGINTEIGRLASAVLDKSGAKPPLLLRMEAFTLRIALLVGIAATLLAIVALFQGTPINEIFFLAVALAVSAIPEGLPVALTVALAIGMNRMARRNVIVRRLVAVEALGSCTFIASDKTGTLTVNELTARRVKFHHRTPWEITGEGSAPVGSILGPQGTPDPGELELLERLCIASVLANEGFLGHRNDSWIHHGDAVDTALLVMAHKAGVIQTETQTAFPQLAEIPFEAENRFSASLNDIDEQTVACVKGAIEHVLPMCNWAAYSEGDIPVNKTRALKEAQQLAAEGYRVLAIADGTVQLKANEVFSVEHLQDLTLLGLVGMIDPLRTEAKHAISACREAGIEVCMITGDHPLTAFSISKELGMVDNLEQVITGNQLREAEDQGPSAIDELTRSALVFARVEPRQKLLIVNSLVRNGHFVSVTGDGANDAPALKAAHVGVAMGKSGTDVARETAELIITDDNFNSIVNGVEEGRIAYANVRKVIFLLVSTGAAEIVLFTLSLMTGLPLPLLAVQLLWLNLVTNGIQDVALAFEPGEGNELQKPPRPPEESIFNRIMIERVVISALAIGLVAFLTFRWLLSAGYTLDEARNGTLLLMVLFENVHVFNSRSETLSAFRHNLLRNKLLLFGTLAAQLIHIGAMYTPWIKDVLGIHPIPFSLWLQMFGLALTILLIMEAHKGFLSWRDKSTKAVGKNPDPS